MPILRPDLRSSLLCGAACLLLLTAGPLAQADDASRAVAGEARFREAQDLMVGGQYEAALHLLTESQALKPGLGVLLNLAYCHEQLGQTATAWAGYLSVAAIAHARGDASREQFARARAAALSGALARLKVVPEGPSGEALQVQVDGTPLPKASWGQALPIDPGRHQVHAHLDGLEEWEATVQVDPHGEALVRVPAMVSPPAEPRPLRATIAADPPPASATEATRPWMRPAAVVAGGLGVGAAALGAYFGLSAKSTYDEADPYCRGDHCLGHGYDLRASAQNGATRATLAFGAAGVLLASGVVLWFTAPRGSGGSGSGSGDVGVSVVPAVARDGASVSVGGVFR